MISGLYELMESLIVVRYQRDKLTQLQLINSKLDILRYQTRLLLDFELLSGKRYQYAGQLINGIGVELGGWIKQQKKKLMKRYGNLWSQIIEFDNLLMAARQAQRGKRFCGEMTCSRQSSGAGGYPLAT